MVAAALALAEHATLAPAEILRAASAPDRHGDHAVRARGTLERQGRHRVHAASVVGSGRRAWPADRPDRAPVFVGGQIGEWVAGVFGAIGTLAAVRRGELGGELVDVSMLEALAMCLTYYPVTFHDQLGRPMRRNAASCRHRASGLPATGWSGSGAGPGNSGSTSAPWSSIPEWMEDPKLFLDRTALAPTIDGMDRRSTPSTRCSTSASAFRIPNAPIANGSNVTTFEHFRDRETFVAEPTGRRGESATTVPARGRTLRAPEAAPRLGRALHRRDLARRRPRRVPLPTRRRPQMDSRSQGLRVLDMTAFWAGPLPATCWRSWGRR